MPLVSIVIPYFRKKKYISITLDSVIKQSYSKIEIILVYDDETKSDLNYIKKLCLSDKRIRLVINNKNIGAGNSRNKGIRLSRGNFLAFIDADDIWSKDKIKEQLKFMQKNKVSFTHTSYSILDRKNKIISNRKAKNFFCVEDLIKSCDIGLSTVMVKKKILSKNKFSNLKTKEDFVLWLTLLSKNYKLYGINKYLVLWRKVDNSLSSSKMQKIIDGFRVYYHYMNFNFLKSILYLFFLGFNYLKK